MLLPGVMQRSCTKLFVHDRGQGLRSAPVRVSRQTPIMDAFEGYGRYTCKGLWKVVSRGPGLRAGSEGRENVGRAPAGRIEELKALPAAMNRAREARGMQPRTWPLLSSSQRGRAPTMTTIAKETQKSSRAAALRPGQSPSLVAHNCLCSILFSICGSARDWPSLSLPFHRSCATRRAASQEEEAAQRARCSEQGHAHFPCGAAGS